jgi:hypothetical protein
MTAIGERILIFIAEVASGIELRASADVANG